ncbi:MAG TPA: isoprenylcysteine carboxylmethyltransferase family protein [Ktedonobacteraceae bacterium]|nr:isoprenylcysteine carboxylmethyltransferase family protein [Ktedonobacteraceae bacterium]
MILALKALAVLAMSFLLMALILFLAAGTLLWPAGWIYLSLLFGWLLIGIVLLLKYNPGLLEERLSLSQPNQKAWDRMFLLLFELFLFAWLVLMALDAVRFHWSQMPLALQVVGTIVLVASFIIISLTFRENAFLSPTVRIQQERGQTVISTGPYHYVRHPMYAGGLLLFLGTPLLLGSWYGLLLVLIMIPAGAARAVLEERVLREELPGYAAYMEQVKYRLIPYVW